MRDMTNDSIVAEGFAKRPTEAMLARGHRALRSKLKAGAQALADNAGVGLSSGII